MSKPSGTNRSSEACTSGDIHTSGDRPHQWGSASGIFLDQRLALTLLQGSGPG